ncbi:MAG TPA: TfoX/Sxy family protein [Polyangia bacterium]|nr:TfoX/Sxy family protein [Polyangia bacterium]
MEAFDAALPREASIERRKMFGYPAAFVRGNMATGLFREQLIVRLPEERRMELLAEPGSTPFEPMPGRPMKEYVVVSPALVSDARTLRRWIREAAAYAASLPARAKKTARKTARTSEKAAKKKKATTTIKTKTKAKAKAKRSARKTAVRGRDRKKKPSARARR